MNVLVAEDDPISRKILESNLKRWGFGVTTVEDGEAAWEHLLADQTLQLAVLDWMMPGCDGPDLCRRVRARPDFRPIHIILLTARSEKRDIVEGLRSGADDYLTKPFDREELYTRLKVGARVVELQRSLAEQVKDLSEALARVKQLQGLLPICCYCKQVRDDGNYWTAVEEYLGKNCDVRFSHGICPSCYAKEIEPQLAASTRDKNPTRAPATAEQ
jgi:CheY-like chemotaxis protein